MNDKIKELEERLDAIGYELQELKTQEKEQEEDWPGYGDPCYTYDDTGNIVAFSYIDSHKHQKRKENRMIFRTREEAVLSRDRGLAYRMLWDMSDGGSCFIFKDNDFYGVTQYLSDYSYCIPCFSSTEKAQEAIDSVGEELLDTIFGEQE